MSPTRWNCLSSVRNQSAARCHCGRLQERSIWSLWRSVTTFPWKWSNSFIWVLKENRCTQTCTVLVLQPHTRKRWADMENANEGLLHPFKKKNLKLAHKWISASKRKKKKFGLLKHMMPLRCVWGFFSHLPEITYKTAKVLECQISYWLTNIQVKYSLHS